MDSPSRTTKKTTIYTAFILDVALVEKLWELVSTEENPRIVFKCSDSSTISTTDVGVLKSFQNASGRQIEAVEFSSGTYSEIKMCIEFAASKYFGAQICYNVSGKDKEVLHIARELDECIASSGLWYSFISTKSPFYSGIFSSISALVVMLLALSLAIKSGFTFGDAEMWQSKAFRAYADYSAPAYGYMIFVTSVIWPFFRRLFPPANFAIGAGLRRERNIRYWRNFLGGGVLLGLFVGILGNFLYARITS